MARPQKGGSEAKTEWRKPQWAPGNRLGQINVPKGFVPRWCDADEANLAKKREEGWIPVTKTTYPDAKHVNDGEIKEVKDGAAIDGSLIKYRNMVAMMMPEELAQARREYFEDETRKQTEAKVKMVDQKEKMGSYASTIKPRLVIE